MTDRRRGLGRGLGALIPTGPAVESTIAASETDLDGAVPMMRAHAVESGPAPRDLLFSSTSVRSTVEPAPPQDMAPTRAAEVAGAYFAEIPLQDIVPNPRQPRQVFDEEALAELVHSIREVGLLQPVVVRQVGNTFELIMGERRFRASQRAGLTAIPAIVRATEDDKLLLDALLENLHRAALNPLEEAAAYGQLLEDFGCTHEALAARIGRSRSQVTNTLRLLKLPPPVQRRVAAGVLSAGHARALLALENPAGQEHLATRIVAEGLSVRAVEELVTMGAATPPTPRRPRAGRRVAPGLDDLGAELSDRWDTRVKVALGSNRGRIVVEFASIEDLDRIVALMAPGTSSGVPGTRAEVTAG
ncbi:MAG: ParB/RepB/Spo0J family partition protein [Sporichthyaceae bacterium]